MSKESEKTKNRTEKITRFHRMTDIKKGGYYQDLKIKKKLISQLFSETGIII